MGHWYPIVFFDFREHAMTGMMVLNQGYALVFGSFVMRKPCQGMDHQEGYVGELGRCVTAQKGVTGLPERLCSREG